MAGDTKDVGSIELVDAEAPHRELVAALGSTKDIAAAQLDIAKQVGAEIIPLDGSFQSQYPKLRVQTIVIASVGNAAAPLLCVVTVGTRSYNFYGWGTQAFPFPIIIERGTDVSFVGANSYCYLIGYPE